MSTLIIRPNAANTTNLTKFGAATYNYSAVNESTTDDTNGVVANTPASWVTDLYGQPGHTTQGGTINSVVLHGRLKNDNAAGNNSEKLAIKIGGNTYYSSAFADTTAFAEYTWDITSYVPTWANIDAVLIGVSLFSQSGKLNVNGYCSQLWLAVNYTEQILNNSLQLLKPILAQ
jgi:hypothetical protein